MMGIQLAMETKGVLQDHKLVVLTGEGRSLEMGAGDFLASFDRDQALTFEVHGHAIRQPQLRRDCRI